jgi:putative component of membrane protein insertase Oxa1/YidC/SpoIIIJ protein YidD
MHCLEALQATKFTPTPPHSTSYVFQIKKDVYAGCKNTLRVLKRHARRQGGHTSVERTDTKLKERRKKNEKQRKRETRKKEGRKPFYSFYFLIYYSESTVIVEKANKHT